MRRALVLILSALAFSVHAERERSLGEYASETRARVTAGELVDGNAEKSVNGLRVIVEGRTIGVTENGFALNVEDVPVNVMVSPLPEFLEDCDRTHPVVSVTGVAEVMLDQSVLLGRDGYVMGVKIDVSSPRGGHPIRAPRQRYGPYSRKEIPVNMV